MSTVVATKTLNGLNDEIEFDLTPYSSKEYGVLFDGNFNGATVTVEGGKFLGGIVFSEPLFIRDPADSSLSARQFSAVGLYTVEVMTLAMVLVASGSPIALDVTVWAQARK